MDAAHGNRTTQPLTRRMVGMAAALVALLVGMPLTNATAAQPKLSGPGGALRGCVASNGVLHVVAFKAHCKHGQQTITFGVPGATGPVGPKGETGPKGAPGEAASQTTITALQTKVGSLESQNATLQTKLGSLEGQNTTLTSQVSSLQSTLTGVSRSGNTLLLSGLNLQLESGSGSTAGSVNGLGNLIVGYNEEAGEQTGSNNLVIGNGQSFTSYGGLLAGFHNAVSAPFSSASGGEYNQVAERTSSVAGGCDNLDGTSAVPTGPCGSEGDDVVSGGADNKVSSVSAAVSGGQSNLASGAISVVGGGLGNQATGTGATVDGGYGNVSSNNESAILGGGDNTASGEVASIAGGYLNTATNDESTVLGGCSNVAGTGIVSVSSGCTGFGDSFQAVVGGIGNQSINIASSILGGELNTVKVASPSGANIGLTSSLAGGHNESLSSATNYESESGATLFAP